MVGTLTHLKEDPATGVAFPKRMGDPEEFARLVESIVHNAYLNGENIQLGGGLRFTVQIAGAHHQAMAALCGT